VANPVTLRGRLRSIAPVLIFAPIALALVWILFLRVRHPGRFSPRTTGCVAAYQRARSAADTAEIDARPAARLGRQGATLNCRALRLSGELR
jgi:hypothetical protein